jgi:hypothetical protein
MFFLMDYGCKDGSNRVLWSVLRLPMCSSFSYMQSYKGLVDFGTSNYTNALQMKCKFITSECKTHYKLYKTCKKPSKSYRKYFILAQKLCHLYHFVVLGLNPSFSSFFIAR